MQLFHDGLVSAACVLGGKKKLQLCKGHASLCFTPRTGATWVVCGKEGSSLGDQTVLGEDGYLHIVLSTLLGDDILGFQEFPPLLG